MKDLNLPPFYVGQRVVAIKDHSQGRYKKGEEFIVLNIKIGCCSKWVIDIGIRSGILTKMCYVCSSIRIQDNHYGAIAFAPIESTFQTISYSKVIEEELVGVN